MTSERTLRIGRGDGLVAALGDIAVLVPTDDPAEHILTAARASMASGEPSARDLARRLAELLTGEHRDDVPAFGLLADLGDELLVFLYGAVVATATAADGSALALSGNDSTTWVDRLLAADTTEVLLAAVGAGAAPAGPYELTSGIVPGGWLRLVRAGDPEHHPEVVPTTGDQAEPAEPADPAEPIVTEPVATTPFPGPDPEPTAASAPTSEPAPSETAVQTEAQPEPEIESQTEDQTASPQEPAVPDAEMVSGILCSGEHFNRPDSLYCATCGDSMMHRTHNLVTRGRPPLGVLVFDDGSSFILDDHYIIGREPEDDPLVGQGDARAITLDDPQMSVSRVHAEILLVGWDVQLIDRGSTNGTHVMGADGTTWERVEPDHPRVVEPGMRGAVGQRTFVYETTPHVV